MLKLHKETLTELTDSQLAGVVGGYRVATSPELTIADIRILEPGDSCVVASCITNG